MRCSSEVKTPPPSASKQYDVIDLAYFSFFEDSLKKTITSQKGKFRLKTSNFYLNYSSEKSNRWMYMKYKLPPPFL